MAPEQAQNPRSADIRADIYSLGCTLYHLLAGDVPFPKGTAFTKMMAHTEMEPRPLPELRGELRAELVQIVTRAMAKDPARRFQTPLEFARALEPFADPHASRRSNSTNAARGRSPGLQLTLAVF